ncbi:MAG: LacI family DNA-binding transcriptional regulator [Spirochaetes bacterium]|nr:LacI family DNA-binding transcriptional regulator [Spirochaetota bacterium]
MGKLRRTRSILLAWEGRWPNAQQHAVRFIHGAVASAGMLPGRNVIYPAEVDFLAHHLKELPQLFPGLAGVIVHRHPEICRQLVSVLPRRVPVLLYGSSCYRGLGGTPHQLTTDEDEVVRRALEHLWKRGHRHIGFLSRPLPAQRRREEAWRGWLTQRGVPCGPDRVLEVSHLDPLAAFQPAARLRKFLRPLTAVFAAVDVDLPPLLQAATKLGLRLPRDLSVAGVDDSDFCEWTHPRLSSVRLPQEKDGALAAEAMLRLLDGAPGPIRETGRVEWVLRESVARPRKTPIGRA